MNIPPMYIRRVGLTAPGLLGWQNSVAVLNGHSELDQQPLEKYKPRFLPANERRRATEMVRLAFSAAEDAVGIDPEFAQNISSIFASSGGDYTIVDQICRALCEDDKAVSPTQFHNSVHNSASGYWGIAVGSRAAASSLSAFDHTFAAGLIEAAANLAFDGLQTLLVTYDVVPPEPLRAKRHIEIPFAAALLLSATKTDDAIAKLTLSMDDIESDVAPSYVRQSESQCSSPTIEALRLLNPAARCLPLLEAIANAKTAIVILNAAKHRQLTMLTEAC